MVTTPMMPMNPPKIITETAASPKLSDLLNTNNIITRYHIPRTMPGHSTQRGVFGPPMPIDQPIGYGTKNNPHHIEYAEDPPMPPSIVATHKAPTPIMTRNNTTAGK